MRVTIYHNILWSKYKGAIFSRLSSLAADSDLDVVFVQIAKTDATYSPLGGVDLSFHKYHYRLLIEGDYSKTGVFRRLWVVCRDLLAAKSDLVVLPGYSLPEHWAMLALCMLTGRRRAVFCDSTSLDRQKKQIKEYAKRLFFSRCNGFFCYGARSAAYVQSYGVSAERIFPHCQAAALPHEYAPEMVIRAYNNDRAFELSAPTFVFLGRLSAEKGLHYLLDSFRLLSTKLPGAKLVIVGAGPLEADLRSRIADLGLGDQVSLVGARTLAEVVPIFYRSVALVLPSYSEPWGLVVNESLSYGCPVVVSDRCGCVPELVIEGVTGYSFAAGDVEALSRAMLASCKLSINRIETAKNCLKVMSAFTPQKAAENLWAGCKEVLESTR